MLNNACFRHQKVDAVVNYTDWHKKRLFCCFLSGLVAKRVGSFCGGFIAKRGER